MAREQEEERQKRLEAESKRHSLEVESQGRQGLQLRKQEQKFNQEVKWEAENARENKKLDNATRVIDDTWKINSGNLDLRGRAQDLSEEDATHRWDQFERTQSLAELRHQTSIEQFEKEFGLRDDKVRHGMGILDQRAAIEQNVDDRKDWKDDRMWLQHLMGNWITEGEARAERSDRADNAEDRADDLAGNTLLNSELNREERKLVAKLWLEDREYKKGRDAKADAFAQQTFGMNYEQFQVQNKQWYDTFNQSKEVSGRQLKMQEYLTGLNGKIKKETLIEMMRNNVINGQAFDETQKQFAYAQTLELDPRTGEIVGVDVSTPEKMALLTGASGVDMTIPLQNKADYEHSFSVINEGDFGSDEFKGAINHIYGNQISKSVGTTISRDVYAKMPFDAQAETGEQKPPGWSWFGDLSNAKRFAPSMNSGWESRMSDYKTPTGPLGNEWSMLGSEPGRPKTEHKGVNLKGSKVVGAAFSGVQPLQLGADGSVQSLNPEALRSGGKMQGIPMITTWVEKDGQLYSYDSPMTKGRGSGQGDQVAMSSMQDFMRKTKGMEQVMTRIRLDESQKRKISGSLAGAAYKDNFMGHQQKIYESIFTVNGMSSKSDHAKALMESVANTHTLNDASFKSVSRSIGAVGEFESFRNEDQKLEVMNDFYRALNSIQGSMDRLGMESDFGKMSVKSQMELMHAFKKRRKKAIKNSETIDPAAFLQDWMFDVRKNQAGTYNAPGTQKRKHGNPNHAFNFGGEWKWGG